VSRNFSRYTSFLICLLVYLLALAAALLVIKHLASMLNPLWLVLVADIIATLIVFAFSVVFKNSSLYDPYWSVAPPLIAWYWLETGSGNTVGNAMLIAVSIWAVRLTVNWLRGWQGLSHEDWRYIMLHQKNPRLYWFTNLAGIHLFPTLMVFMGLLPVYFTAVSKNASIECENHCFNEVVLALGCLISITATLIELVADEQMRTFKKKAQPREYINTGLWKYSRHPNYFGEIAFWFGLWVMQMAIAPEYWYTAIGFIAMLLMFLFASIPMIEDKNRKSKPGYDAYIANVSVLIPLPRATPRH
jgi:steroid 5-alpha reductase family enzyme